MQQVHQVRTRLRGGRDGDSLMPAMGAAEGARAGMCRLAAIGDLMQCGEWQGVFEQGRLSAALSPLAAELAGDDLVFANLETTCPGDAGRIDKEPLVIAEAEELAACLQILGVDVVNLANNHAFDCLDSGFERVRTLLDEAEVTWLGAGKDHRQAAEPRLVERHGVRFAWLAYADSSSRPSHLAGKSQYGVNDFDVDRAVAEIEALRDTVDHVVVSLHWGIEYCHIPSPQQVVEARRLIDAGARLVIGHHVHVVQGVESYGGGAIAYNLGNATTSDHHVGGRLAIHQTPRTRSSFVLRALFSRQRLEEVEMVPIRSEVGRLHIDDATARRYLEAANRRLAAGISAGQWKRTRFYEDLLVRTARKLHPKVIRSIRPKHFLTFARNIAGALSGRGPSA